MANLIYSVGFVQDIINTRCLLLTSGNDLKIVYSTYCNTIPKEVRVTCRNSGAKVIVISIYDNSEKSLAVIQLSSKYSCRVFPARIAIYGRVIYTAPYVML